MSSNVTQRLSRGVCALILAVACVTGAEAQQKNTKPLMSEEIRAVIERDGADAARRHFEKIYPEHKDRYEIDMQGLAELAMEYMQAGDQVTAGIVLNMSAVITRDMVTAGASMSGAPNPPRRRNADPTPTPAPAPVTVAPDRGLARDDLERFRGVYGLANAEPRRDMFVTVSCDGYLVIGAMWADVSNYWMRSVSDHVFEMSDSFRSLRVEFEMEGDGPVRAMHHDLDGLVSPLPRTGPLPRGWGACVHREGG